MKSEDIRGEAIHHMMSNEFKEEKWVEISQPPYHQSYL